MKFLYCKFLIFCMVLSDQRTPYSQCMFGAFGQLLKQSHHQLARISSLLLIITHCTLGLPRFKQFPLALNLASAVRSLRQIDHKADDDRLLQLSISMFLKILQCRPEYFFLFIIGNKREQGISRNLEEPRQADGELKKRN